MRSTSLTSRSQVFSVYRRKPRRKRGYVVVQEADGKSFCHCWYTQTSKKNPPPTTADTSQSQYMSYPKTGIAFKPADLQNDHVILHRKNIVPPKLLGEEGMTRDPLKIVGSHAKKRLTPCARLDLSRVYRIYQYLRARQTGYMSDKGLVKLLQYRKEIRDREEKLRKVCGESEWARLG